jgi:Zn-dependent M28 family amino/carboxypeptidase
MAQKINSFLHVTGEEHGLLGSQYYSENPLFSFANTITDINIDMIGRRDKEHAATNYVYLIGADRLSSDLNTICIEGMTNTYKWN